LRLAKSEYVGSAPGERQARLELTKSEQRFGADEVHLMAALGQRFASSVATMPLPPTDA
jgi:hypothetical protein